MFLDHLFSVGVQAKRSIVIERKPCQEDKVPLFGVKDENASSKIHHSELRMAFIL